MAFGGLPSGDFPLSLVYVATFVNLCLVTVSGLWVVISVGYLEECHAKMFHMSGIYTTILLTLCLVMMSSPWILELLGWRFGCQPQLSLDRQVPHFVLRTCRSP